MPLSSKSEENIQSAKHLIGVKCYSSSIHCSYYGCLQKILDVLNKKLSLSKEELNKLFDTNKGSHVAAINLLQTKFNISSHEDARGFYKDIQTLKRDRVKADYRNIIFNKEKSEDCLKSAVSLIDILNKNFK